MLTLPQPFVASLGTLKGGTGKSMMTIACAGVLAESERVLVIDADPQCNATANLGVSIENLSMPGIIDVFVDPDTTPELVIIEEVIEELPNLDLLPSNILLTEAEMNLFMRANRERILTNWFNDNADYLSRYRYILIDTNPSMGLVNQNVFALANSIILVSDVGQNGILGAETFIYLWGKKRRDLGLEDNIKALIINNSDIRLGIAKDIREYIEYEEQLKNLFVEPVIPYRAAMKSSESNVSPITILAPNSDSAEKVRDLVSNLKKKGAL